MDHHLKTIFALKCLLNRNILDWNRTYVYRLTSFILFWGKWEKFIKSIFLFLHFFFMNHWVLPPTYRMKPCGHFITGFAFISINNTKNITYLSRIVMSSVGVVVVSLRVCMLLLNYMTIYMNAERKMKTIRLQMISFSEHFCVKWYDLHVIGV